jgi:hypothetical protein
MNFQINIIFCQIFPLIFKGLKKTSGYPRLCRLVPARSTSGLSLAASPAFPCNTPGWVHRRSLSRSPTTSSPSPQAPRPTYTCGTPVARCFTGLSLPHPPCRAWSSWTSREHKTRCSSFRDLVSVSYVDWSKSKTPVTNTQTMRLISRPRFS